MLFMLLVGGEKKNLQSCFFCIIHVISRKSGKIVLCLVELSSALFPPSLDVILLKCSSWNCRSCILPLSPPCLFMSPYANIVEILLWKLSKVSDGKFLRQNGRKFPSPTVQSSQFKVSKFWCLWIKFLFYDLFTTHFSDTPNQHHFTLDFTTKFASLFRLRWNKIFWYKLYEFILLAYKIWLSFLPMSFEIRGKWNMCEDFKGYYQARQT